MTSEVTSEAVVEIATEFREELKKLEKKARDFIFEKVGRIEGIDLSMRKECIEQATIAMRHIEDARMKYGKVIQYSGN
jgi:ribosomal protein S2